MASKASEARKAEQARAEQQELIESLKKEISQLKSRVTKLEKAQKEGGK